MAANQLSPKEVKIIQMALTVLIEDLHATSQNQTIPFTPEARMITKEMLDTAKSALAKIALASGHLVQIDPYQTGDENEFLTKQS
jgi:hypothetical protein